MLRWNKNVEMVLGFSKEELLHRFTGDFIDEPDREKVISEFFKVLTEGEDRTVEYNMLTKSGKKIPYLGSGSLAVVDGKEYLVGIAINISKLRKAEEKLIAQLAEINRLKNQLQAENIYLQLLFNARISRSYLLIASTMPWTLAIIYTTCTASYRLFLQSPNRQLAMELHLPGYFSFQRKVPIKRSFKCQILLV